MTPETPETPAASRPVLQTLRDALADLTPTLQRVAEEILEDPLAAGSTSITALAGRAGTNAATVSRLAPRLGYSGFPELRSAIALENGRNAQSGWERDIGGAISLEDPAADVLDILAGTAARALRDAVSGIDVVRVEQAARVIAGAERVHLYGEWGDSVALRELHLRLQRIGVAAWFLDSGPVTLHAVCNTLTEQDVVVVLNRSGEDDVTARLLREASARGATTVAVHGMPGSPVDHGAEISVYSGIRNGEVWTHYYSGRASDTLVTSLLWVLVAQYRSADNSMRYFDDGMLGGRG
ncbi:MurR/RpiR family transcriptional regulator [Brachybacterium sp. FME24]|uniref:MurR/RpiR family transcriptional regulator n=1 Tax=Brachybacterium sp. FME24 TaxID=2742605 RepID=UPI0018687FAF|nr:MurR/RpiR family transcriptional regulator [Brachybacterium sp. FME24]